MARKAKSSSYKVTQTEKILPPEGMHNARAVRFLELGTQETEFGDKFKCQISFELVDESAVFNEEKGEQNFVVHRTYNRSLGKRSDMGKAVRALLGSDYVDDAEEIEMDEILDQPCQVQVKYSDDEKYANIVDVLPPNKKVKVAKSESELASLYLDDNFDQDVFNTLPDWMQEMIADSPEGEELEIELEKPKSKKKGKNKKEEEDEDDKPRSKRGKSKPAEEEEEEDEPKSRRKSRKDSEDDEDDDEPKSRKSSRSKQTAKPARKQRAKR
jgi:hypothetical protein